MKDHIVVYIYGLMLFAASLVLDSGLAAVSGALIMLASHFMDYKQ